MGSVDIFDHKAMDLLEFGMQAADGLTNAPIGRRRISESDGETTENLEPNVKYRRSNQPSQSQAKKYDGYDHRPCFDEIENHRKIVIVGQRLGVESAMLISASQENKIMLKKNKTTQNYFQVRLKH